MLRLFLALLVACFAILVALDSGSRGFKDFDLLDPYKPGLKLHYKLLISLIKVMSRTRLSRDNVVAVREQRERVASSSHWFIRNVFDLQGAVLQDVNVTDTQIDGVDVRIYVPTNHSQRPNNGQLVFFHGGGFVLGSVRTHDRLCRRLCHSLHRRVVSVNYRKAPEFPFPAAIEDSLRVVRFIVHHNDDGNDDGSDDVNKTTSVVLMGDSAGANIAAVVARNMALEGISLEGQVLVYPVTDFVGKYESHSRYSHGYLLEMEDLNTFYDLYFEHSAFSDRSHPNASIVRASVAPLTPPTLIVVAQADPLVDEALAYAKLLQQNNVSVETLVVPGVPHAFFSFQMLYEAQWALNKTVEWIRF